MNTINEIIESTLIDLDKIESSLNICVNELYKEESKKEDIAAIIEMILDKLALIKLDLDILATTQADSEPTLT